MRRNYKEEADNLIKAIDISIEVLKEYPLTEYDQELTDSLINHSINTKDSLLNVEKKFRNLTSLKYFVEDIFTFFQEGSGKAVNEFWKKISEAQLPYERVNKLEKILKRKKIKDDHEYNYVIDTMVPYYQEGTITEEEFKTLDALLGKYSSK